MGYVYIVQLLDTCQRLSSAQRRPLSPRRQFVSLLPRRSALISLTSPLDRRLLQYFANNVQLLLLTVQLPLLDLPSPAPFNVSPVHLVSLGYV